MSGPDPRPLLPIGAVARRTGLSPHVLRAWERRYGVVTPVRTEGGDRLYSTEDVLRLRLLAGAVAAGHPIGRAARMTVEELVALDDETPDARVSSGRTSGAGGRLIAEALEAVEAMDGRAIHAVLNRAVVTLGAVELTEEVIVPLLHRVGELWAEGAVCPAHEHLLSVSVHRVLSWIIDTAPLAPGAPLAVATTPSGHRHELGTMLAAVVAATEGWKVTYLGPDLPAGDVAQAVAITGAGAVLLSVVYETEGPELRHQLEEVRRAVGEDVRIVVGGRGALPHADEVARAGATYLTDLGALRTYLRRQGRGDAAAQWGGGR